jgi:hypothetical protein
MSKEALVKHLATDPLVAWAWSPGLDLSGKPRTAPTISHEEFGQLAREWVDSGAQCPS